PDWLPDQGRAAILDGFAQGEALAAHDAVAETFIRDASLIGGFRGGSEPTFIDAAAVRAVGVCVVGVEFDAQPRLQERARHPSGGESQQAACAGKLRFNDRFRVAFDYFERANTSDIHDEGFLSNNLVEAIKVSEPQAANFPTPL